MNAYVDRIERLILDVIQKADPEWVSDVLVACVWLSGAGALLPGLCSELERRLKFAVGQVQDPLGAVIIANGMIVGDSRFLELCRNVS